MESSSSQSTVGFPDNQGATDGNRLITGLTLNGTFIPASAVAVEGTDYATATSAITVSTGASAGSLQLTVQVNGTATLEVAALNVIELL